METDYLYLVLSDQEIFAALVMGSDQGFFSVQESCLVSCPDLRDSLSEKKKVSEDQANDPHQDKLALSLGQIAENMDLSSCSGAVICFPTHWASFRTICLPFENSRKIRQVLDFELEGVLPLEEEYASDFYSLGNVGEVFQIFTGSLPERQVQSCVSALKSLGISAKVAAPFSCIVAQGFMDSSEDHKNGLLVIKENRHLVFILIWQGRVRAIRSMQDGKKTDSDMIKSRATQMLVAGCQESGIQAPLPVFLCLDSDQKMEAGQTLSEIITKVPGVEKARFCENWGAWAISLDPDKSYPYMIQFVKTRHPGFPVFRKYAAGLGICASFLWAILVLWFLGAVVQNVSYTKEIQALDARARTLFLETFPASSRVQDPYLQMTANVKAALRKNRVGRNGDLGEMPFTATEVLSELSEKIDPSIDVMITRFLLREKKLSMAGTTNNFNNVEKIKTMIETSALFTSVEISNASADKTDGRVHFGFLMEM